MKNIETTKSYVYIWNGHILFARHGINNEFHSHHAAAVIISFDSNFIVETETSEQSLNAAIITPDTYHSA